MILAYFEVFFNLFLGDRPTRRDSMTTKSGMGDLRPQANVEAIVEDLESCQSHLDSVKGSVAVGTKASTSIQSSHPYFAAENLLATRRKATAEVAATTRLIVTP